MFLLKVLTSFSARKNLRICWFLIWFSARFIFVLKKQINIMEWLILQKGLLSLCTFCFLESFLKTLSGRYFWTFNRKLFIRSKHFPLLPRNFLLSISNAKITKKLLSRLLNLESVIIGIFLLSQVRRRIGSVTWTSTTGPMKTCEQTISLDVEISRLSMATAMV